MLPTLAPGDVVWVRRGRRPRSGDLVVCRLPGRPLAVKRAGVRDTEGWWVESDNPGEGTDSWKIGAPVAEQDVLGVVVRVSRPRRNRD